MREYVVLDKKFKIKENKVIKIKLINDHFENAKVYDIEHAQLIIADIPYNLGSNAYASNPNWWKGKDFKNGESELANKKFFDTDEGFKINNFFDFCTRYMNKEPVKGKGNGKSADSPAMIVFCSFEQIAEVMEQGKKHGLNHSYPLIFCKKTSAQVLKVNMKILNGCEYGVVLYREKLPKFRNIDSEGKKHMILNWFEWEKDGKEIPRIHPTQKPVKLLKKLIEIFTDEGDVVIDPVAGSGSTLRACMELKRSCYGFEIKKEYCNEAKNKMLGDSDDK